MAIDDAVSACVQLADDGEDVLGRALEHVGRVLERFLLRLLLVEDDGLRDLVADGLQRAALLGLAGPPAERLLDPLFGKSLVVYFTTPEPALVAA